MAYPKKRRKKRLLIRIILPVLALIACFLLAPYTSYRLPDEGLSVRFFDVGQGDAALVKCGNRAMLIDGGTPEGALWLLARLYLSGVTRLDVTVATHPHDDHVGGLPLVLALISSDTVMMPDVSNDASDSYQHLLRVLALRKQTITHPNPGTNFRMNGARVEILAPRSLTYADLNDTSICVRVDYGVSSFLFTGDAEAVSEQQMLSAGAPLRADVLKVGHHGSSSSSTQAFLEAVRPRYAVISVGAQNDYGHPTASVLARLSSLHIKTLRTDERGSITFQSDGTELTIATTR